MIRLVMLPSKASLRSEMTRLALKHVDYGAKREHGPPFKTCLMRALKRYVLQEGALWNTGVERSWKWTLDLCMEEMFGCLDVFTPKVQSVRSTWQYILTKLAMRAAANPSHGSGSKTKTGSRMVGSQKIRDRMCDVTVAEVNVDADGHTMAVERLGAELAAGLRMDLPDHGRGFTWSESHGRKLGSALELIVSTMTEPHRLEQTLWHLAQKHMELGVTGQDLPVFEKILFKLLQDYLPEDKYTESYSSWKWLWGNVSNVFVDVLEKWKIMQGCLQESWGTLLSRAGSSTNISEYFYGTLFKEAPLLQDLFQRRNQTMVDSFAKALDLIVRCSSDSSLFDRELEDLAVRHCKYDLQSWHFDVFGDILVRCLADLAADDWTDEHADAWRLLYSSIASVFVNVLDTTRNPMCNALVRNSVDGATKALERAPRSERALRALYMRAGKRQLSPLLWALRDGLLPLVALFLDDLMAIRCDRASYYYGVADMWQRCPTILEALIEFAPDMIEQFLDGHMRVSKQTVNGWCTVNMWVRYIYGDPSTLPSVFDGPLATLVDRLPQTHFEVFTHPIVVTTVGLKWERYGKFKTIIVCIQQVVCLIAYLIVEKEDYLPREVRFTACVIWVLVSFYLLTSSVRRILRQFRIGRVARLFEICGREFVVPCYLLHFYVLLRLVCCVLSLVLTESLLRGCWQRGFYSDDCISVGPDLPAIVSSLVAVSQWTQLSELFKLNGKFSAMFYLARTMGSDALRFMAVLIVWLLGTGAALYHLLKGSKAAQSSDFETAYALFAMVLGRGDEKDFSFHEDGQDAFLVKVLFMLALWVSIIPILNLMVAAMVSTYSTAEKLTVALATRARAVAVLEAEDELSDRDRFRHFDSFEFEEPVLLSAYDKGPPGGITLMMTPLQLKEHPSYKRREDNVLFFSGSSDSVEPWPSHAIPQLSPKDDRGVRAGSPNQGHDALRKEIGELKMLIENSGKQSCDSSVCSTTDSKPHSQMRITPSTLASFAQVAAGMHCLVAVDGLIYDVERFASSHPGGERLLRSVCGKDASEEFHKRHSNVDKATEVLQTLPCLGQLVPEVLITT
eukprot:TRINITY_DN9377_c0_g2_i1.p1 TRINITY_DN9377_c0_g2~~TRINITY_DN9377_c0_g2_i1.p1  ORF type:complete len:1137 (+),score=111.91 TRINITY_DN9377_c0_g2_i1:189-3413(+)